jgi:GAF domain-containing protein
MQVARTGSIVGSIMPRPAEQTLAHLVGSLADAGNISATVEQIVRFARETVGADHAGITLLKPRGRGFETIGHTDQVVWDLDELQHQLNEGPCVDASVEGESLWSADLGNDPRWPNWGPAAAEVGLHSVLSIELHGRGERIGALNLYGDRFRQFTPEDAAMARMFAFHAASALATARQEENFRQALSTRTEIGQAQGILMERFDIDASQAFNVLRRYSQDNNLKLVNIARSLITERELPAFQKPAELQDPVV